MLDDFFIQMFCRESQDMTPDQIKAEIGKSGTKLNVCRRAIRVGNRAEKAAEKFGFVGVGVISFREARLAKFRRLVERRVQL